MSRGRFQIDSTSLPFTPSAYGLLSPATTSLELANAKWRMGLQWQSFCPAVAGTYGECAVPDEVPAPNPKGETWEYITRGATPVTIYSRADCAPVGQWEEHPERNRQAPIKTEASVTERTIVNNGGRNG